MYDFGTGAEAIAVKTIGRVLDAVLRGLVR